MLYMRWQKLKREMNLLLSKDILIKRRLQKIPVLKARKDRINLSRLKMDSLAQVDFSQSQTDFINDFSEIQDWLIERGFIKGTIPKDWLPQNVG